MMQDPAATKATSDYEEIVNFRHRNAPSDATSDMHAGDDCTGTPSVNGIQLPARSRFWHHVRRLSVPLLLGQILSALIAITGISSRYLVQFGVSLPLTQNLPSYFLLAVVYGFFSWRRLLRPPTVFEYIEDRSVITADATSAEGDAKELIHTRQRLWQFARHRGWQYFLAGTVDVHANWAIVSAYNFTNMTSVQLLDCLTIPTAMLLSRVCLHTRYHLVHIAGVIICLIGAGAMVGADYLAAITAQSHPSPVMNMSSTTVPSASMSGVASVLLGDFLVVIGAIGYGISNVYQEYLVRSFGIIDFLNFSALTACTWTLVHCLAWELPSVEALIARPDQPKLGASLGCLAGYAGAMFLLYTIMPFALSRTNAVLVNLSLLTADLYALLIGIFLFQSIFHPLYIASFIAVMLGVCLFASRDPIFRTTPSDKVDDTA